MVAATRRVGPLGPLLPPGRPGVDLAGLRAELGPALASARTELRLVLPAAAHGLAFARSARGPVAAAAARGVRVRLLAEDTTSAVGAGQVVAPAGTAGIDVRVLTRVAFCLLVADDSVAFAVLAPPEVVELRDPDAVAVVGAFFDERWGSAWRPRRAAGPAAGPDPLDRAVLAALASGCKDEVAARQLGLSVRSLRRRIAELLDRLGAGSRFEAGVRAAELGWVGDREAASPRPASGSG